MRNYSSARANKGKTAYRTPSVFRYQKSLKIEKIKAVRKFLNPSQPPFKKGGEKNI